MSALGQKQTSEHDWIMSALPPKADMLQLDRDVRFAPKADIRGSSSLLLSLTAGCILLRRRVLLSHAIELCLLLVTQRRIKGAKRRTQRLNRLHHRTQPIVHRVKPCCRYLSYLCRAGSP